MLNKLTLFTFLLVLTSCEDFTQRNIEFDTKAPPKVEEGNNLLTQANLINQGSFSLEKLLANTGTFVAQPLVSQLKEKVTQLDTILKGHCRAINILPSIDEKQLQELRRPLQEAWKEGMLTFHKLSLMNFGPGAQETSTAMDSLYSFDGEEKCRVDLQLFRVDQGGETRLPRMDVIDNYSIRGFDSLEPLFFANPNKSRCSRSNPRLDQWFQKPLLDREKVVCTYALHLSKDMVSKATELDKAWSPQLGYYTSLMLSGNEGSPIEVTNDISQALFALDSVTKDRKIAFPAGFEVRIDGSVTKCTDASCPDAREHPYAEFGYDALLASLEGFKILFSGINTSNGTNGFGLDDLLISRDKAELSQNILSAVENLIIKITSLKENTPLKDLFTGIDPELCEQTTSENRLVEACALVWDMRKVTNLLKNDYLNALGELSAPRQAQGDND